MLVLPNFISNDHRLQLLTVTFIAYQAGYIYLKRSRYYYKYLQSLVLNTFLYFSYLKIYFP
jgi:hypothetical protein